MIEPQAPAHPAAPAVPGTLALPEAPPETAAPTPGARPVVARNDVLASLGRRFRGATLTLGFELRTGAARQIFHRDFVYVSRQLHALEASRRVQGIDRQVLKEALAAVTRRGDAVRTVLMLCASEARALIAVHGHAAADVDFARPTRLQATIVSPHARDFLDLIGQADDALTQLEKAWLLGLVDPHAKSLQASECRRALIAYKECVRQQRHVVGTHVREVNAARRTGLQGPLSASPVAGATDEAGGRRPAAARGAGAVEDTRSSAPAAAAARPEGPVEGAIEAMAATPPDPSSTPDATPSAATLPSPSATPSVPTPTHTPMQAAAPTPVQAAAEATAPSPSLSTVPIGPSMSERHPGQPAIATTVAAVVAATAADAGSTALALAFAAAGSRLREALRADRPAAALDDLAPPPTSPQGERGAAAAADSPPGLGGSTAAARVLDEGADIASVPVAGGAVPASASLERSSPRSPDDGDDERSPGGSAE